MTLLLSTRFLIIFELHVYELLKFVLKSLSNMHCEAFLNNLHKFQVTEKNRRIFIENLIHERFCRVKIQHFPVSNRGARLFIVLRNNGCIPPNIETVSWSKIQHFYHNSKESYILGNDELINSIFK